MHVGIDGVGRDIPDKPLPAIGILTATEKAII